MRCEVRSVLGTVQSAKQRLVEHVTDREHTLMADLSDLSSRLEGHGEREGARGYFSSYSRT